MYILLTDILTCPRCGPEFGLILLADRMEERRVLAGVLGCANCREHYPITGGYGAFGGGWPIEAAGSGSEATATPGSEAAATPASEAAAPSASVLHLAALLGVTEGPGFVLLVGAPAMHASALADMIPGIEVIAASDSARTWTERTGVSRIGVARTLPFLGRRLRGIALSGEAADGLLDEAARSLGPLGRLVLLDAPTTAAGRLADLGLAILAQQDGTIVAART